MSQKTGKSQTDYLNDPPGAEPMPDRGPRPETSLLPPPWRLLLQVGGENTTTIGLQVRDRTIVGRIDEGESDSDTDVDLNPYGGFQNGVSRKHAIITHENGALYVEDLGSTNGTRINGFELIPHKKYRLRDGDELEFGRLRIVLRFVRPST
jgi:pSer/pThr/pTyr-binding forkhead associated (FHA) protein